MVCISDFGMDCISDWYGVYLTLVWCVSDFGMVCLTGNGMVSDFGMVCI